MSTTWMASSLRSSTVGGAIVKITDQIADGWSVSEISNKSTANSDAAENAVSQTSEKGGSRKEKVKAAEPEISFNEDVGVIHLMAH